jgi:uncharacterized delta-60 repeat protein
MVILLRALLALMTGLVFVSCGSSSNSNALAKPGISTVVITPIAPDINARATAAAIQSDGKIVAAGYSFDGGKNVFALIRYLNDGVSDGTPDTTFGTNGIVTTPIGTVDAEAQALAVQSADQKLVVAGFSYNGSQYVFTVARYNPDGTLDAGFGSGGTGIVTTPIGSLDDRAFAVVIQSDGKIVVAGYSTVIAGMAVQSRIALVRYTQAGAADAGFGTNGIVITDPSALSVPVSGYCNPIDPSTPLPCPSPTGIRANAVTIKPDPPNGDLIIVAGVANGMTVINGKKVTVQDVILAARYKEDGTPDTSFNGSDLSNATGVVTTAIGTGYENDEATAVAIDENDSVVVAGSAFASQRTVAVVRYTDDGSLDTTFNNKGTVTTPIDTHAGATALGFYLNTQLNEQQIVVAGTAYNKTYGEFVLARYNPDGHLDSTFGSGGKVTTEIRYGAGAFGLAMQSDGKPVAAGYSRGYTNPPPQNQSPSEFTLARYGTDGKLDTTFPPQP